MNQGNFEAPERVEKSIDSVGDSVILHAEWRRTPLLPYSTGWRERRGRERFIASRPLVFPLFLSHFLPPSQNGSPERVVTSREIPRFFLDAATVYFYFYPPLSGEKFLLVVSSWWRGYWPNFNDRSAVGRCEKSSSIGGCLDIGGLSHDKSRAAAICLCRYLP